MNLHNISICVLYIVSLLCTHQLTCGACGSTWCTARVAGWTVVQWSMNRTRMPVPPSWWIGCCRQRANKAISNRQRCCQSDLRTFRWLCAYQPFPWPSPRRWRCSRTVRRRCACNKPIKRSFRTKPHFAHHIIILYIIMIVSRIDVSVLLTPWAGTTADSSGHC